MRRINFFSPYIAVRRTQGNKSTIFSVAAAFVLVAVMAFYGYNAYSISKMNDEMETMTAFMNDPVNIEKVNKCLEAERKLGALKLYSANIDLINNYVGSKAFLNSRLLAKLDSTLPKDVFLQGSNVGAGSLQLQGIAGARTSIAEYQYNLKKLRLFKSVFTDSIVTDASSEGNFIFAVNCTLADGGVQ